MTITAEIIPIAWSAADEAFFRVVQGLFSPAFLRGTGALLASYDAEPAVDPARLAQPARKPAPAPAASGSNPASLTA